MSTISARSRVHIIRVDKNGQRWYLHKTENIRHPKTGDLLLKTFWDSDPSFSRSQTFEVANLIRERIKRESRIETRIALQAGDAADLIQD
jgi:hypothetical protein